MKPLKGLIKRFGNYFTALYINNVSAFRTEKTGHPILFVPFRDPEIRLSPVVKGSRRRDNVRYRRARKTSDTPEGLHYLRLFDRQLVRIGKMLIVAASAPGEMGAPGGNAQRRRLNKFVYYSVGMPLLNLSNLHQYLILRGGIGDKDGLILIAADSLAAKSDIVDVNGNDHSLPEEGNFLCNIHDKLSLRNNRGAVSLFFVSLYNPGNYC
jgi:hypothetical protein